MSEALENKAVEILDKSQAAIGAFADKLGEMAKQYGPDVAEAALQMARIDAVNHLVIPVFGTVTCIVVGVLFMPKLWAWRRDREAYYVARNQTWNQGSANILAVVVTAGYVTIALISLCATLDVWKWAGVFEPKLWLAKRILGL